MPIKPTPKHSRPKVTILSSETDTTPALVIILPRLFPAKTLDNLGMVSANVKKRRTTGRAATMQVVGE